MKTKIALLVSALITLGLGACGTGVLGAGGGSSRTIEVDYRSDDFAGSFLGYFPREVTVTPGMTLNFHQTWTGEPHSVTFGKLSDDELEKHPELLKLLDNVAAGKAQLPNEPPESYDPSFWDERLPGLFSAEEGLSQGAAKPCYAKADADLPLKQKACAKADQKQPEFTGTYAYYSSGFIPFEGERGNTFEMKIADNAKDGTYFYYCNVHGVPMGGKVTVKKDADVESQAAINRRGREESKRISDPLLKVYNKEKAGQSEFKGNLAGSGDDSTEGVEGIVNEFTPRTIDAKVGDKVTWTFIGNHTISFNVPAYTPLFKFDKKGDLTFNEGLDKAAGGWPGPPEGHDEGEGPPPPPIHLDAGDFDGSGGLKSSGTGYSTGDTYAVTFTKAGTYPYACLIHPGMIGKVVVK
jgi:plastocyanin